MKKEDISNTYIHLTNVAIQKHAPGFDKEKGMKGFIRSLRTYMNTRHGKPLMLCSMTDTCVTSLGATQQVPD